MSESSGSVARKRRQASWLAVALAALAVTTAGAAHLSAIDTEGHTTVEQTLVREETGDDGYSNLQLGPGEEYIVRDGGAEKDDRIPAAQEGRDTRRVSLAYVSQLTDFQLADEESPARVEFLDPGAPSAWRPQEGFTPFQIEATVRQINRFVKASPVSQGDGTRNSMDFALLTGDQADNQHFNETVWVRDLLEGNGPTNFNSGLSDPAAYGEPESLGASCPAFVEQQGGAEAAAAEGARYTGVQDYDDYPPGEPISPLYYDPDDPRPPTWTGWPEYRGLMDRAQQIAIDPVGLDVPFYITNGNHDVLVQGNEDANAAFEEIATGCLKVLVTTNDPTEPHQPGEPDPNYLLSPAQTAMLVPPDPDRRFVSKVEIKALYGATDEGPGDDDHGFKYVDAHENAASGGSASYYAWDPPQTPGLRFISVDTNAEGGQTAEGVAAGSASGNIDDPQFQWLKRELQKARARHQMVVLFGHHPVRNMDTEVRDEQAAPCAPLNDEHPHNANPGCDLDPRPSDDDVATPGVGCIHNGTDAQNNSCPDIVHESFVELIEDFPNVIGYIPGHTHEHQLTPFSRTDGPTWWEINTSSVVDPPNQSRLVELMDNRDGTLSWFNTVVDHAAPASAPQDCPDAAEPCAADFDEPQLASIGRTFSYNDPDNAGKGLGDLHDRNAELLLEDPRPVADLSIEKSDAPDPVPAGSQLTYRMTVMNDGPADAHETTVVDEVPAGVSIVSYGASQGSCTRTGQRVECRLGVLPAGVGAVVRIVGVAQQEGQQLTNTARVRGNVSDREPANDSATQTTAVGPPAPNPGDGDGDGDGGGGSGGGGNGGGAQNPGTPRGGGGGLTPCASAALFNTTSARGVGRRLRLDFSTRDGRPAAVDVFQVSKGRRVVGQRLVARFAIATRSFTWDGRANRPRRRVRDGFYFVRFRTTAPDGRVDVRRVTLRRSRGRWSRRPSFHSPETCDLLASFKLHRPVFGGSTRRPLLISYRLTRNATVRVEVRRGSSLVRRFRPSARVAGSTYRLRLASRRLRRGDYRVRITATSGGSVVRTLVSRRL